MFQTILVAVDLNDRDSAARVVSAALRLAAPEPSALHLLNVVPDSGMAMVGNLLPPDLAQSAMTEAKSALERFAAEVMPGPETAALHVVQGTIYDQILRTARDIGADTIVVGANRPELADYLIGPNATRVARHADQSVLVVR